MVLKYLSYFWWSHMGDVLWLFPVSGWSGGTVYLRVCTPMWPWGHHGHIPQQRPRQEEEVRGVPPYLLCQNEVHPDQQGEKCQPQVSNIQGNKPPNSIQQLINSIYLKPQTSATYRSNFPQTSCQQHLKVIYLKQHASNIQGNKPPNQVSNM